jgi:ferredoxin-NADP reductase
MGEYRVKLVNRREVAERTMAFHFQRPPDFQFKPGQYADLTLTDPPETDAEGNIRTFSIASAPFEPALMFTTRMRDTAFKRVLKSLPIGSEISLAGPMGSFALHNNSKKPGIFLAGGIGITPFLSIILQAAKERLPHQLSLFYSNRRPEDAPFVKLLREAAEANPNFRFIPTMTQMAKSHQEWGGETSVIDRRMLERHIPSFHGPIYYTAGPPAMVSALRKMLVETGVDEDDIRSEEFAGY